MRILSWVLLPFCASIVLSCYMGLWWLCWPLAFAGLAACVAFSRRKNEVRRAGMLAAIGAMVGFLWFGIYTMAVVQPVESFDGRAAAFSAVVTAYPRMSGDGTEVQVKLESGMGEGNRAVLFLDEAGLDLKPGDRVIGEGEYESVGDLGRKMYTRNVSRGFFFIIHGSIDSTVRGEKLPWTAIPSAVGRELIQRIQMLYRGERGALLTGLITGDESKISSTLYTAFRRSGMAHLLAVSGLHVGFLTGVLYIIPGSRRRRVILAIPLLVFFAMMTGETASVWRAVIMASILLSAPLFGRENDPITSVSVALAVLLIQNPYACRGIGLQLSFAAVAGLACFHGKLYHWMTKPLSGVRGKRHRLLHEAWYLAAGALSTALAANVLTLPLCAIYFQSVSLAAPLSNLLTVWCASVAFVLGLLSCLVSFVSIPAANVLVWVVNGLLDCMIGVAKGISRGSFSALTLDNPYYVAWFVTTLVIIAAVILVKQLRQRLLLTVGASAGLLLLALSLRMLTLSGSPFTVTALDVGKGSCTVIGSQGTYVAVDCQGYGAGNQLADYLTSGGTKKLSLLVLDQLDAGRLDNMEQLLSRVDVECVAVPAWNSSSRLEMEWSNLLQENGCKVMMLNREIEVAFGEARVSILPMIGDQAYHGLSVPVLCSWNDHYVLLSGELDAEEEQAMLERWTLPKLDVLIAANGGSKQAAGLALLSKTRPDCAVLSAGGAPFDPPREEVLRRLASFGTVIYTTERNGTVTIRY